VPRNPPARPLPLGYVAHGWQLSRSPDRPAASVHGVLARTLRPPRNAGAHRPVSRLRTHEKRSQASSQLHPFPGPLSATTYGHATTGGSGPYQIR
jgi:hypothetical protein